MMSEMIKCALCGKQIDSKHSHDIRPIKTKNGNKCCEECNFNIVIPTRLAIWPIEDKLIILKDWLDTPLVWTDCMVTIPRGREYEECRDKIRSLLED